MDVVPATNFDFTFSSPTCYTSAPSSPTRLTELLVATGPNCSSSPPTIPFAWEEKPGVPKTIEDDFSFSVSCRFDNEYSFKTIDPVPYDDFSFNVSCRFDSEYSFKTIDPVMYVQDKETEREREIRGRGRDRGCSPTSSRSRRTRSLSPLGTSEPLAATSSSNTGSRTWSLLDLLLFRSASDGRAMDKDPLKKYFTNFRKHDQDIRNSGSVSKRRGRVSAHELHYNVNRAVSNDMKKKTYLPYKQGILGKFSFNP